MEKIDRYIEQTKPKAVYVYIQFVSMNAREKFLRAIEVSEWQRVWYRCFKKSKYSELKHKYIGGRWPEVKVAPDPSLIQWKNLGVEKTSRVLRGIAVYFLSFMILFLAFSLVIFAIQFSNDYKTSSWKESDCGQVVVTREIALLDL